MTKVLISNKFVHIFIMTFISNYRHLGIKFHINHTCGRPVIFYVDFWIGHILFAFGEMIEVN